MPKWLFNFLIKISPNHFLRQRMRFFAMLAIEKFKKSEVRDAETESLIFRSRFWASELLKRKPNDPEAKLFVHFPESMSSL